MLFLNTQILTFIIIVFVVLLLIVISKYRNSHLLLKKKNRIIKKHISENKQFKNQFRNNLQVIYSLLNLHLKDLSPANCEVKFINVKQRISVFFKIYNEFFESKDLNNINLKRHGSELILNILNYYQNRNTKLELFIAKNIYLKSETFTNLGLIINELISNNAKHSSKNNKTIINITKNKQQVLFSFNDTGAKFNIEKTLESENKGLGFYLILKLVKKMEAKAFFSTDKNGLTLKITF